MTVAPTSLQYALPAPELRLLFEIAGEFPLNKGKQPLQGGSR